MKLFRVPRTLVRIFAISALIVLAIWWVKDYGLIDQVRKLANSIALIREHDWILKTSKLFLGCGHTEITETRFPSEARLKAALPGDPGRPAKKEGYTFSCPISVDEFCLSCKNNQFLCVRDQNVVIIRGTPEKPGPVVEKTSIKVTRLPEAEIADLKKGIPFRNGKEKLQLIEGLNGLTAN